MSTNWNDPKTVEAVALYMRMIIGAAIIGVILYSFIVGRVGLQDVLRAIGGLLAIDRIGVGALGLIKAKADDK